MSMDFPRAWQIARNVPMNQHHRDCSFNLSDGGILCDCDIVTKHPEYSDQPLHTTDGRILAALNAIKANQEKKS